MTPLYGTRTSLIPLKDTQALQAGQYWAKALLESGAELSLAGHKYRDNFYVDPAEEDALISKSIDIFSEVTGQPPKGMRRDTPECTLLTQAGWFAERRSNLSVKLYSLAHQERQIPLAYSSDSCSDDLPYWVPSFANRSQGLLMIPYSYDCSDLRFNMKGSGWASPKDYYLHLVRHNADYVGLTNKLCRRTHSTVSSKKQMRASPR